MIIENKVGARESDGQLQQYEHIAEQWCGEYADGTPPLLLFLTPQGRNPTSGTSDTWLCLSYAQLASALRKTLRSRPHAPGTGWLSEETADSPERLAAEEIWVVDPIDGTKEFIKGIPEFAISIGLALRGEIVVGVIYNPARDELFWAGRGEGARLNGDAIRVSERGGIDGAMLDASRAECRRGEFENYARSFTVHEIGRIAYKLARVAAGRADVTWSLGSKNEWDIAAGVLLVEEAGGRATDPRGGAFRFNRETTKVLGILATNGRLLEAALRVVAPEMARRG